MANELTALIEKRSALVVETQTPIALEIQELLLEHGAAEVRLAVSFAEAERALNSGFHPDMAVVDLARFDGSAEAFVTSLQSRRIALVLTMASLNGPHPAPHDATIVLTKPYLAYELLNGLSAVLRSIGGGV